MCRLMTRQRQHDTQISNGASILSVSRDDTQFMNNKSTQQDSCDEGTAIGQCEKFPSISHN